MQDKEGRSMKAHHTDEGVITHIERIGTSTLGNPTFRVHLDNGNTYRTKSNSSVAYEIQNSDFRGPTVRLLLTEAHRIWDISVI
jgi:hypothetical protein